MKNITPHNKKGQAHGCWKIYYHDGKLIYKGNWNNGMQHGLWEYYWYNGCPYYKGNYNNGDKHGYWEWYNEDGRLIEQVFYA